MDKTNPPVNAEDDFINTMKMNDDIASIFKASCYDCHSNETKYPWYTAISPLKFWIGHHIEEGREHLNFSEWGTYSLPRAAHKLEECIEMVEEDEMPMESYTFIHRHAILTPKQKESLLNWLTINYDTLRRQAVLSIVTGQFEDDYGNKYDISKSDWKQDTLNTFHIEKWNYHDLYVIAQNDTMNQGERGLYSRIDIVPLRRDSVYNWCYCFTSYSATSAEEAEKTELADKKDIEKGCNGHPFSRMKVVE